MEAAIEVDRQARGTPQAWMLNRFLVPASRLVELPEGFDPPLGVIVDVDELPPLSPQVEVVEARLERAHATEGVDARVFLEIRPGDDDAARRRPRARRRREGALRRPDARHVPLAVPSSRTSSAAAATAGSPSRPRPGLHHPIRDGIAHGFLNLLGAAVLAHAEGAGPRDLVPVLLEEDAGGLRGDRRGVHRPRPRARRRARWPPPARRLFVGYGSCSFSEPVEDLRGLRIL